jgi:hypothetical protein
MKVNDNVVIEMDMRLVNKDTADAHYFADLNTPVKVVVTSHMTLGEFHKRNDAGEY